MKKEIILLLRGVMMFVMCCATSLLAQNPPPLGLFELNPGGISNIKAFTPDALGVGTNIPHAKLEVKYCSGGHEYTGLMVTRKSCGIPFYRGDLDFDGFLGNGGEPGSSPLLVPHFYTPVTAAGLSPIRSLNKGKARCFG